MTRLVQVVDDDDGVRKSVGFLLRSAGFAVAAWRSGTEFLEGHDALQPACILLDMRMPAPDGLAVQANLAEHGVGWPVIMFTGHGDLAIAVRALEAGAVDFIEKPFERRSLLAAVERAFGRIADPRAIERERAEAALVLAVLSDAERQLLELFAAGLTNRQVSDELGVAPHIVEVRRAGLLGRLGKTSLSAAVRLAFVARHTG